MPDITRLLTTLRRAAQLLRDVPGREGKFVELTGATELLAAGDLHGHVDNFRQLLRRADLARHPSRHLLLQEIVHGPRLYPDGGDKSHQLVDLVAALVCQFPKQVHFLLGNHELAQWTDRKILKADHALNERFRQGVATAYGRHADEVYDAYLKFFQAAPLAVRTPNRVFLSHSLPPANYLARFDPAILRRAEHPPEEMTPKGSIYALVWGRDTRLQTAVAFLKLVDADWLVSGHIPCPNGYDTPNERQLILDSMGSHGCYCLFPTQTKITLDDLVRRVVHL
jgi:hypothetical protein